MQAVKPTIETSTGCRAADCDECGLSNRRLRQISAFEPKCKEMFGVWRADEIRQKLAQETVKNSQQKIYYMEDAHESTISPVLVVVADNIVYKPAYDIDESIHTLQNKA